MQERERHLEARRLFASEQSRAIANCVARIEAIRAEVFAANDGVVTSRMTALEAEWRRLSRSDPDGGMMDLWARIAPSTWIDRKRWRGSDAATRVDAAVALASDVEGVEAAEAAIDALRAGTRVRWCLYHHDRPDFDGTAALLARATVREREAVSLRDGGSVLLSRAHDLERGIYEAAIARFPEREALARALAHATFVDCVWQHASSLRQRNTSAPNPVAPLRALWSTGYVISAMDDVSVTLEIPPLTRLACSDDS